MTLREALTKSDRAFAVDADHWVAKRQGLGAKIIETTEEYRRYHSVRHLDRVPNNIPQNWYITRKINA